MNDDAKLAWLRLANVELTPRAAHALLDRFGAPQAIFDAAVDDLASVPELSPDQLDRLAHADTMPTRHQIAWAQRSDITIIGRDAPEYPAALRDLPDRPAVLFVRGELIDTDRFAVALVGTRRPSPYGRQITARLSRELCDLGLTIVSGGAVGIDAAAHRAAVAAQGRTIVVLGCGLDVRYPADNQDLFMEVLDKGAGAIISEYPFGAQPEAWRFPNRNRLISGLSMGVVVVEAGQRSGGLLTAGYAADQGREVMAVPGSIDSEVSAGTNALIRDGAALVTCGREIAEALGVLVMRAPRAAEARGIPPDVTDVQRRLLEKLSLTPKPIDTLASDVGMPAAEASAQLTLLELRGLVIRQPGGTFIRAL